MFCFSVLKFSVFSFYKIFYMVIINYVFRARMGKWFYIVINNLVFFYYVISFNMRVFY